MLGCQDFCGYYDWTFNHIHSRFGERALAELWSEAIGTDSQDHYSQAGKARGLRGLYECWTKTGVDEKCDWNFTLDEERNVLRWDMRQCPSKGFLLKNDLNKDEDYCDHCMGWMMPLLDKLGVEIAVHEHNHCGQCWGEMRVRNKPYQPLDLPIDIRKDPRWQRGYLDRWRNNTKLPALEAVSDSPDSVTAIEKWFAGARHLLVLGRGPSAVEPWARQQPQDAALVTGSSYAHRDVYTGEPLGVLIGIPPFDLEGIAKRFNATEPAKRPLLMYSYLPAIEPTDFAAHGLPRPMPILPLLIRRGLYAHTPGGPYPTTGVFLVLLAAALNKPASVAGIDLYRHPSGQVYVNEPLSDEEFAWPALHSPQCDLASLRRALDRPGAPIQFSPALLEAVKGRD